MFGQVQAAFESGLIGALGSSSAAHTAGAAALSEAVTRVSNAAPPQACLKCGFEAAGATVSRRCEPSLQQARTCRVCRWTPAGEQWHVRCARGRERRCCCCARAVVTSAYVGCRCTAGNHTRSVTRCVCVVSRPPGGVSSERSCGHHASQPNPQFPVAPDTHCFPLARAALRDLWGTPHKHIIYIDIINHLHVPLGALCPEAR